MLPSTHPFIQTLVLFDFVPLKSSFRDTLVALGVFFIKILKVLNSPHSFYFSSTLEGVKQPVCAPPLLGWNPALLQRCVCQCVSVLMRLMGGRGPLFESLQAALQMKKHTSDCLGDHMPLKLCSQTWECQRAGIWKRRMKGIRLQAWGRGSDGSWWEWSYSSWAASDCSSW